MCQFALFSAKTHCLLRNDDSLFLLIASSVVRSESEKHKFRCSILFNTNPKFFSNKLSLANWVQLSHTAWHNLQNLDTSTRISSLMNGACVLCRIPIRFDVDNLQLFGKRLRTFCYQTKCFCMMKNSYSRFKEVNGHTHSLRNI